MWYFEEGGVLLFLILCGCCFHSESFELILKESFDLAFQELHVHLKNFVDEIRITNIDISPTMPSIHIVKV